MMKRVRESGVVFSIAVFWGVLLCPICIQARWVPDKKANKPFGGPSRVLVLDGTNVHNVGELQIHVFNWGEWGSRPGTGEPSSFAPSAQWPAGSGINYLFSAGLWVGAVKNGIPAVSTATFERELRPSQDLRDILYRATEGDPGGGRPSLPRADDDGDGAIDEDRLDGYDNDGDGLVDEDFSAISTLMFACQYTDDQPVSLQIFPDHDPLNILVRQESYQWSADRFDDIVGMEYQITNIGNTILNDVYIGMFIDGDAGPIARPNYWTDDLTARRQTGVLCTDQGVIDGVDVAYTYDADGDDGQTTGLFGVTFLGHTTDPTGRTAPPEVRIATFAHFSGQQPFELGGDPTNDFERYEVLAQESSEPDAESPRDYRMLVSAGPFLEVLPGSTLVVQMAFVIGESVEDLLANAASAHILFKGAWFDLDNDPTTGVESRETPVYPPHGAVFEDPCRMITSLFEGCDFARLDPRFNDPVMSGETVWTNADCGKECAYKAFCGYFEADSVLFRTGLGGRETQIHWLVGSAPPPPHLRIDDHARDGVVVYWDNFSETIADARSGRLDFEGYRFLRADDWTRPLGTSLATGPPTKLWRTLWQADRINSFGEDVGLDPLRYEPLTGVLSTMERRDLIDAFKDDLMESPEGSPPCPRNLTAQVCDTLEALARWELGLEGGRRYYRYVDRSVHLGAPYFYSVIAFDHGIEKGRKVEGIVGDPASGFVFVEPKSAAQAPFAYDEDEIYVVPNPVTSESMAPWSLGPTNQDPAGVKVEFRNLLRSRGVIRVYTLSGDLVKELRFDATQGVGTVKWDLVNRNGQAITSGVYLYSVEFRDSGFPRVVKKFTVIR